jgi:hypothetical protein
VAQNGKIKKEAGGKPQKKRGTGRLRVVIFPWADVFVDGQKVGSLPIVERALPAGPHRIRIRNPTLGKSERIAVEIEAGELLEVRRKWVD